MSGPSDGWEEKMMMKPGYPLVTWSSLVPS